MSRVITALAGIPLLIVIIGWGHSWHFSLLVLLVTTVALYEYFSIAFPNRWRDRILGILLGVLVSMGMLIPGFPGESGLWLSGAIVVAFSTYLFFGENLQERYNHLGWTLLGALYVGYLVPHFVLLYQSHGREWVFFILLVVMAGDTAAYVTGSFLGRRKLSPKISPGKTVEGALGGTGASVLAGVMGAKFLLPGVSWLETLWLSLALSVLGQAGDLFESWIKRVFGVKDSGKLLPGHGGLLDRIDSLIFPVVFTTHYLRHLYP